MNNVLLLSAASSGRARGSVSLFVTLGDRMAFKGIYSWAIGEIRVRELI